MSSVNSIPHAVLALPARNKDLVAFAKTVLASMTANAKVFPTPSPTLTVLGADITAFDEAETVASKAPAEIAQRNAAKLRVVQDLRHLCDYVQTVVEVTAQDPVAVITSAGLRARKTTTRNKAAFAASDGPVSGTVRLDVRAVAKIATYYWQFSSDDKTWTSVPDTIKTSTTITGLTAGQTYWFRFRAMTRVQLGDFSQAISYIVR